MFTRQKETLNQKIDFKRILEVTLKNSSNAKKKLCLQQLLIREKRGFLQIFFAVVQQFFLHVIFIYKFYQNDLLCPQNIKFYKFKTEKISWHISIVHLKIGKENYLKFKKFGEHKDWQMNVFFGFVVVARTRRRLKKFNCGYKYISELWKKKQSDVLRFLKRIRAWNYRQLPRVHRTTRPTRPDKAHMLGYKRVPGFVVYRVRVKRGGRRRPNRKGVVYGKPANQVLLQKEKNKCEEEKRKQDGINQLKNTKNLRSIAEERVGKIAANLRVLNSYHVTEDGSYKWYEVILVDPRHKVLHLLKQIFLFFCFFL
ncbi:hypothetical protein RFI_03921 [Reticulomyxa filosa]|uniref:Ribosomal protein L15 n=1 Tax=Reticulomyxa filosa TaxID=46433 RepID=X6P4Z0_RETFI|nr:hypothetical protein RFI_03921 [Reticulomyxa filosa]|eukprot:ETO33188.1 hypothetical protein RFI_03921 [Reticulomyxa filosa]